MKNNYLPLVSIITPVFNGAKYIRRTIESILSQNYPNIQYIVMDGGSTDNTLNILNKYKNKIDLIISEPDQGMYDALNKGIKLSSGKILCYINADDYFFPDTINRVVTQFFQTNAMFVFGNCIYVDKFEHELYRYSGVDIPYHLVKRLGRIPFAQQSAFWIRDLYDEIGGFDQSYKYVADTKFFFECLRIVGDKKSHLNEFLSMFRQHDDAFSTKVCEQMRIEHDLVLTDLGLSTGYSRYIIEAIVKGRNYRNFIKRIL
jgi:glycosyltransferase involved in cell wall biosynthesis